jgi:hypothetical protein
MHSPSRLLRRANFPCANQIISQRRYNPEAGRILHSFGSSQKLPDHQEKTAHEKA